MQMSTFTNKQVEFLIKVQQQCHQSDLQPGNKDFSPSLEEETAADWHLMAL